MQTGNDIADIVKQAAADTINSALDDLAGEAIDETPVDTGELRASAAYPAVDQTHAATPDNLTGMVSFNKVYAAAQHEGEMQYVRDGKLITWKVTNHPKGGKDHYLEDPFKANVPRYETVIGLAVKKALAEKVHG